MGTTGIEGLTGVLAQGLYLVLFLIALWGAFCVIMVWLRISQKRFRDEEEQDAFLKDVDALLASGEPAAVQSAVAGDLRAMPQMTALAIEHRQLGPTRLRQLLVDRFQRDVLSDLEHRLSWVQTVIKSAPMVGLLGTVMGMMGAFAKLATAENVKPDALAQDISFALITTACGLAIAIPLVFCMASVNVRIRKMEDLVAVGLERLFDIFRQRGVMSESPPRPQATQRFRTEGDE
jgi:biopolymer transport protein ExbB/TolQ